MDVRYSAILPVSGSTLAVISFIFIPRIPRIVFLASSTATSAASSQLLSDVPTISTILATLVTSVFRRSSQPACDDVSFLPLSSSPLLDVIIEKNQSTFEISVLIQSCSKLERGTKHFFLSPQLCGNIFYYSYLSKLVTRKCFNSA